MLPCMHEVLMLSYMHEVLMLSYMHEESIVPYYIEITFFLPYHGLQHAIVHVLVLKHVWKTLALQH